MAAIVRPYQVQDRSSVRRIYAETAFFGEPVEAYLDDRELFADLGVSIYVDNFADYAFVAESGERVAGYIVGCPSGDTGIRAHTLRALPYILGRLATGRYSIGRKTLRHAAASITAGLRGEMLEIRSDFYPANLHINLLPQYRGQGQGSALMHTYLEKLRASGIGGVHLVTTDRNRAALHLYRRFGFALLAKRKARMWMHRLGTDVTLMALGLRLETGRS